MRLFSLFSALVVLSGCAVALKGTYVTEKKDFWFDKDGHDTGDGLYYCKAHDNEVKDPKPVCYLARSVDFTHEPEGQTIHRPERESFERRLKAIESPEEK